VICSSVCGLFVSYGPERAALREGSSLQSGATCDNFRGRIHRLTK
jgi:hypothetical protein